jgi:Secretion system C-terminal sorting domain
MKALITFILMLTIQQSIAQCNVGSYTVTGNQTIKGSCIITGDLTIQNGATLNVDLTGATADTFVVRGNISLYGNAVLWVHSAPGSTNDQFVVSSSYKGQRTITTNDSSRIQLENIEFSAQESSMPSPSSLDVNYNAIGHSIFYINNCWLNTTTSWILCNMKNNSTLLGYNPNEVPTEIYLQDTAKVALHGANTKAGIWLNCEGVNGTLTLPSDQSKPFTWKVGKGAGGFATQWYFETDTASVGLAVQIFSSSKITINGTGLPATGELKVALNFANGTDTIKNLKVGLQNATIDNGTNGKVILNNVNLGPIAWQLYALQNENLFIKNSTVNEIGIGGPSSVTIDSCLLQFAMLSSVGIGGSKLTINNSEIWNQGITASNNSKVILNNCKVTGSIFSTTDTASRITVNGGCFYSNPSGCTQATMVNTNTGQPYCNAFIPSGYPQNLTPSSVIFSGINYNCTTGISETKDVDNVKILSNPANQSIQIELQNPNQPFLVQIYSTLGQQILAMSDKTVIDTSNFTSGMYILRVTQSNNIWTTKIFKY